MVGGRIVGLARGQTGTLLHVQDNWDHCSIRIIERQIRDGSWIQVALGDQIWWQQGHAYWTPRGNSVHGKCGVEFDIKLTKVGYSH